MTEIDILSRRMDDMKATVDAVDRRGMENTASIRELAAHTVEKLDRVLKNQDRFETDAMIDRERLSKLRTEHDMRKASVETLEDQAARRLAIHGDYRKMLLGLGSAIIMLLLGVIAKLYL